MVFILSVPPPLCAEVGRLATNYNTYCFLTCCNSSGHSGQSKDSTPCNTPILDSLLATAWQRCIQPLFILCFLVRTASCHKPGPGVFNGCIISRRIHHTFYLYQKKKERKENGAICNRVCPHSSERVLQCAITEGRGTTQIHYWKQLLLIKVLCFIWNMVSGCIQVLKCLYIMWVSYFTILTSAIPISRARPA